MIQSVIISVTAATGSLLMYGMPGSPNPLPSAPPCCKDGGDDVHEAQRNNRKIVSDQPQRGMPTRNPNKGSEQAGRRKAGRNATLPSS
jgi:hypothetical protein